MPRRFSLLGINHIKQAHALRSTTTSFNRTSKKVDILLLDSPFIERGGSSNYRALLSPRGSTYYKCHQHNCYIYKTKSIQYQCSLHTFNYVMLVYSRDMDCPLAPWSSRASCATAQHTQNQWSNKSMMALPSIPFDSLIFPRIIIPAMGEKSQ